MGDWITKDGWRIAISNMGDALLTGVIAYAALGGGWSSETILACIAEMYGTARERGLIGPFSSFFLKTYTKALWKGRLKDKRTYAPVGARTPCVVSWILATRLPYCGNCD